jgi:hypothetical protein
MAGTYTFQEYADMHLIYREVHGNSLAGFVREDFQTDVFHIKAFLSLSIEDFGKLVKLG